MNRLAGRFRSLFAHRTPVTFRKKSTLSTILERLEDRTVPASLLFAGSGPGSAAVVQAIDPATGQVLLQAAVADPSFLGGVHLATADFNLDGIPDPVVSFGPGGGPQVQVLDGTTLQPLPGPIGSFYAYQPSFRGGANVAAADVDGDGVPDVITTPASDGGPHLVVFSGRDASILQSDYVFDPNSTLNVAIAAADFTGDGNAEVVAASGGVVKVFDLSSGNPVEIDGPLGEFTPFGAEYTGDVVVAAAQDGGDVDGDGTPDLVVGTGAGVAPDVKVYSGSDGTLLTELAPFDASQTDGFQLSLADIDGDGNPDLVASGGQTVRVLDLWSGDLIQGPLGEFAPFEEGGAAGVAATNSPIPQLTTVSIEATDPTASETAQSSGAFVIRRTEPGDKPLTVTYTVLDGPGAATPGDDYQVLSGEVTIPVGKWEVAVPVVPVDDAILEPTETVTAQLTPQLGYTIDPSWTEATVSILDNDREKFVPPHPDPPIVTVFAADPTASEAGTGTGVIQFQLSWAVDYPITLNYTIDGSATNGIDYQELPATVTIPAGSLSTVLVVTPFDDVPYDPNETVTMTLSDGEGYVNSGGSATVTIGDTYLEPTVAYDNLIYTADPSVQTMTLTVVRVGDLGMPTDVDYSTENLSAFAGLDYGVTYGTLHFDVGDAEKTFTVPVLDHDYFGYRAFHPRLANPTNAHLLPNIDGAIAEITGIYQTPDDIPPQINTTGGLDPSTLKLDNRAREVLIPGLIAVMGAGLADPPVPAQAVKPGLYIAGNKITTTNNDVVTYLLSNGRFPAGDLQLVKLSLIKAMINSEFAPYAYGSKEQALEELDFRIEAALTMLRIDGGAPGISFGYAGTDANRTINTTYWELGPNNSWWAITKLVPPNNQPVDSYAAVITGLEAGTTRLECLAAMQASYYIATAKILGAERFRAAFPGQIKIGYSAPSPFLDLSMPWLKESLNSLATQFGKLSASYATQIRMKGKIDQQTWDKINSLKDQINVIIKKKEVAPVTGDFVYFANSRFYRGIYPDGGWVGENTIAYLDGNGQIGFTGMGVDGSGNLQPAVNVKAKLVRFMNEEDPQAVATYKATLASYASVQAAAAAKNMTAAQYAELMYQEAIKYDVSLTSYGSARLVRGPS
jgi:hypothetical protein